MCGKYKINLKKCVLLIFITAGLFFNASLLLNHRISNVKSSNFTKWITNDFAKETINENFINIVFFSKHAYKNMKIVRGIDRTLSSILNHTATPIHLHILLDLTSKLRISRTLKKVTRTFKRRLNVTFYDVEEMSKQSRHAIATIRQHFFTRDVGRYGDDIFFLSEVFHTALPRRLRRIIFLDVDLRFLADIADLNAHFQNFLQDNVIGIGPDLQPQYRMDFAEYRNLNPNTPVGSKRPGLQGFNTGVVLFDLERMRRSRLYNSLLNSTLLGGLCNKYHFKGYLGHQDFYTITGMEYPQLYYQLDCSWNRQLDVGWSNVVDSKIFDGYHACDEDIKVLHANGDAILPEE